VKILFIILTALTLNCSAQYTAFWTGWGHKSYEVQQGLDSLNWTTIGTVNGQLAVSDYSFDLPATNYYYRVKADKDSSQALLVSETLNIKNNPPAKGKTKTRIATLSVKVNVGSQIHYTIESQRDQLITYSLYNNMGQKIASKLVPLHIGQNEVYDRKPDSWGVYYGTFEGYFDFVTVKVPNYDR
jgi:hypothetical protein